LGGITESSQNSELNQELIGDFSVKISAFVVSFFGCQG
jgi:hypothetical protein